MRVARIDPMAARPLSGCERTFADKASGAFIRRPVLVALSHVRKAESWLKIMRGNAARGRDRKDRRYYGTPQSSETFRSPMLFPICDCYQVL